MSDDKVVSGAPRASRSSGSAVATGSRPAGQVTAPVEREQLERALSEMLSLDRSRSGGHSRHRRLAAVSSLILIALALVIIGSVLALGHLSPKVLNATAPPSTTTPSVPTTTGSPTQTTLPPAGGQHATAVETFQQAGRNQSLTGAVGQGSQPITLERTKASTFITNQTATPVVEYLWSARCGACTLENLVVATSLIELGGRFQGMTPLTQGQSISSVGFGATYQGPVVFEPVEAVGLPGRLAQVPTPQARAQFNRYDTPPYATNGATYPFVDVASHYVSVGSEIPSSLVSGLTLSQIANSLHSTNGAIARAILGSANILTAGICTTMSDLSRPLPAVCVSSVIEELESQLPTTPPHG